MNQAGFLQRAAQALGAIQRFRNRRVRQDAEEFLAAPAATDVDLAQTVLQQVRQAGEYEIAHLVAMRVVDGLEVVNVEDDDREFVSVAAAQLQLPIQFVHEMAAIE